MRKVRRPIGILLALVMLLQLCPLSAFAAETQADSKYKNFVILGDSICLGFSTESASMTATDTFDLASNVYRAANAHNSKGELDEAHDYTHCYPTLVAKRLGIDTFQNNQVQNIFTPGDEYDDVYNFGVCAAWSKDIYELLTEPYHPYEYYTYNYDEDTTFVLPKEYRGERQLVDTSAPGYDVGNPATWVYRYAAVDTKADDFDPDDRSTWTVTKGELDWIDSITKSWWGDGYQVVMKTEEYVIPEGTPIHVATSVDYGFGASLTLNEVIQYDYYLVGKDCLDENGDFIDTNGDGKVDNYDVYYYPCKMQFDPQTYAVEYVSAVEESHGEAILNPQFTKYYYSYMTDKVENGDLVALACGGNDVYHTFMDKYMAQSMTREDGSINGLATLLYLLNYAFQTNMTVGQILDMLSDPDSLAMMGMMLGIDLSGGLFASNAPLMAATAAEYTTDGASNDAEVPVAAEPAEEPAAPEFGSFISMDDINWLLDYYSNEKVTAYMQETIDNYKVNYEKCIQRCLKLMDDDSELVLVGHYNPFGMVNYFQMLSQALERGTLLEDLSGDLSALANLLLSVIGTSADYSRLEDLTEEEFQAAAAEDMGTLEQILASLGSFSEVDDKQLTKMIVDLSFPLVVLLMNDALSGTYAQFNDFVVEMADKYDLAYVDISDAPASGRYDPHPTAYGHQWIADRVYETVVPEINASIAPASTGEGTLTPVGNQEFRLRDSQTYAFSANEGSKVSAIFIDGERADDSYCELDSYTFEEIMKSHTFSVQFDKSDDPVEKYAVNVVNGGAAIGGAGMYAPGANVTVSAGTRDGYVFDGWQAEGVTLTDPKSATTSFVMPKNDVTLTATWKVDENEHGGSETGDVYYTLSFETNGGTAIPEYTKLSGTTLDLSNFLTIRDGYTFAGWYTDRALTKPVTSINLTQDTTVYAKWTENRLPFTDVKPTDWSYDFIAYAYENGLMSGTSATTFSPWVTTSRGMIVTILYSLADKPAVSSACPFTDVASGSYYEKAITWATENGIVSGYGNGKFGPDDSITREQMAAILYKFADFMGYDVSARANLDSFTDAGMISSYAKTPIAWANAERVINGTTATTLSPQGNATREQVAAMLYQFCENVAK